jgi:hypothetical protein
LVAELIADVVAASDADVAVAVVLDWDMWLLTDGTAILR